MEKFLSKIQFLLISLSFTFVPKPLFALNNEISVDPSSQLKTQSLQNTANTIHLSLAMKLAIEHSHLLKAAQSNTLSANEERSAVLRSFAPVLSGSSTAAWKNDNLNSSSFKSTQNNLTANAALTLTQPLLGLIPLGHSLEQKNVTLEINKTLEKASSNQAALLGAQSFLNYELANSQLIIAQSNLTTLEKSKSDSEALFQTGSIYKDDYLNIVLQWQKAQQQFKTATLNLNSAIFSLGQVIGKPNLVQDDIYKSEKSHWEKHNLSLPNLEKSKEIALAQNEDIIVAQENVQLQKVSKKISQDNYLPSLNAFVTLTKNFQPPNVPPTSLPSSNVVTYGLQLNWSIWDWGSRASKNNSITEQISSFDEKAQDEKETILKNIVTQYNTISLNLSAVETARESVKMASEVYDLVSFRFLNGQVKSLDLITAQQNLTTSKADLAQARFNLDLTWLVFQQECGENLSFTSVL